MLTNLFTRILSSANPTSIPPFRLYNQKEKLILMIQRALAEIDFFGLPHPKSVSYTSNLGDPATTNTALPGFTALNFDIHIWTFLLECLICFLISFATPKDPIFSHYLTPFHSHKPRG